jgi:hypothetical protein
VRIVLPLFVALFVALAIRAEPPPTKADFDNQIAKLTPGATKEDRLTVAKWLQNNYRSEHAPRTISLLEELARKDPESTVRQTAVAALVHIAHRHDVPCPLGLILALRDPVDEVRWMASVLGGPYERRMAPGAFDALLAATADERAEVRSIALIHLSQAAGKDPKGRAVIEKAKADKNFDVRNSAHIAWFKVTDDMAEFLAYTIRVREEPQRVLNVLPEGSEEAKTQQYQRNMFILGSASRIADWNEDRPDALAVGLLKLLEDKSALIRRGAVDLMGNSAQRIEKVKTPEGPFGTPLHSNPFEAIFPYIETGTPVPKEKPSPQPLPSKTYASLLARKADVRLYDLAAKDPDETVRASARQALSRWREIPVPLDIQPRELK